MCVHACRPDGALDCIMCIYLMLQVVSMVVPVKCSPAHVDAQRRGKIVAAFVVRYAPGVAPKSAILPTDSASKLHNKSVGPKLHTHNHGPTPFVRPTAVLTYRGLSSLAGLTSGQAPTVPPAQGDAGAASATSITSEMQPSMSFQCCLPLAGATFDAMQFSEGSPRKLTRKRPKFPASRMLSPQKAEPTTGAARSLACEGALSVARTRTSLDDVYAVLCSRSSAP